MTEITVIDAMCGAGKTSYAIQMMNESYQQGLETVEGFGEDSYIDKSDKFIYVTPFLDEVKRVKRETNIDIITPMNRPTKRHHVDALVKLGHNIAMTHELFARLSVSTLSEIESQGYTLIMDEVANVLQQVNISKKDIDVLVSSNFIEIEEDSKVKWIDKDYDSTDYDGQKFNRFNDIKILAEKNNLYMQNGAAMFWVMDVQSFSSFDEVYILTYLFDGQIQKYYYDIHDLDYEKKSVTKQNGRYVLKEYNVDKEPRNEIGELLSIYEDYESKTGRKSKLNSNYDNDIDKWTLSSSWFEKASNEQINQLNKNLYSFFKNRCSTPNNQLFWTAKKSIAPKLVNGKTKINKNDDRTKDNFLPLNARATNEYRDRTAMAYVYNRFMNPMEKSFFYNRGVSVNEDMLAQSDLIQFLFRGCIRNNKTMNCYIPSKRMRELLYDWLEYK